MPNNLLTRRRNLFFYFLSLYLLAMFFWWWFMILRQSKELYIEKEQLLYLVSQQGESGMFEEQHEKLLDEKQRKQRMIIGEGITFLVLMLFGMYRLRATVQKEIDLAGKESNFLLSITHELKSPLASAKLNLQTLKTRSLSRDQQTLLLENTETDITRLNNLVEKILLASRIGHESLTTHKEELNFSELVESCAEDMVNRNSEFKLKIDIQDEVWVNGDELMLKSLVLNLLENAMKYTPEDTFVELGLNKEHDMIVLSISDEGHVIPNEEKSKIFDRFYRMGSEETRTSSGVGLGLFIVKQVALMHHGHVKIVDNKHKGKTFKVEMPYIGTI